MFQWLDVKSPTTGYRHLAELVPGRTKDSSPRRPRLYKQNKGTRRWSPKSGHGLTNSIPLGLSPFPAHKLRSPNPRRSCRVPRHIYNVTLPHAIIHQILNPNFENLHTVLKTKFHKRRLEQMPLQKLDPHSWEAHGIDQHRMDRLLNSATPVLIMNVPEEAIDDLFLKGYPIPGDHTSDRKASFLQRFWKSLTGSPRRHALDKFEVQSYTSSEREVV